MDGFVLILVLVLMFIAYCIGRLQEAGARERDDLEASKTVRYKGQ